MSHQHQTKQHPDETFVMVISELEKYIPGCPDISQATKVRYAAGVRSMFHIPSTGNFTVGQLKAWIQAGKPRPAKIDSSKESN